ncbi:MAG: LL-diaminopimelate aminotransferase [Methanohalobium sp.]|uniref:LL-diaminopimelate aminotransferase n=1 Tax=Methanohalobium sp. TaxID=2837493 RepID=UPI00397B48CA
MYADRINSLPPYLFAAIDEAKAEVMNKGVDVIDLGVGDPDQPTPQHIIDSMSEAIYNSNYHRYPSYNGMYDFRKAAADWCKKYRGFEVDPDSQTLTMIGLKEGIAHSPLAFINPGDTALVPNPAYPVYKIGTLFAGGEPYTMPLLEDNEFLPNLDAIPKDVRDRTKMMFLNYPNNPTGAVADYKFFEEVVDFARDNNIVVIHDNAYSDIVFDGYESPSFMNVDGAMDVGVELYSLSKTYNMTGWRIAFAVGNSDIIKGIGKVKSNVDSGAFEAVQKAGVTALTSSQQCVSDMNKIYKNRRDALLKGLNELGLDVKPQKATFYTWAPVPEGYDSIEFSKLLLEEGGIVATPGVGFGDYGDGYIRFALTQTVGRINQAVARMEELEL